MRLVFDFIKGIVTTGNNEVIIESTNDGTFDFDTVESGDITIDLGDRESVGSSADYGNRI
jgi:hypothetical protein